MKTTPRSLLFIALALAAGNACAQDAHAGHHQHDATPAADPHAAHRSTTPKADAADAHAGHEMTAPVASRAEHAPPAIPAVDPHAGHAMPTNASDAHAGHMTPSHAHDHAGRHAAAMQTPREPVPALTNDDMAAAFPMLKPHSMEHASTFNSLVLFDHLEAWNNAHGSGQSWDAKGWFGGDVDRLWLRSEGRRSDGHLAEWSLDALYGHSISPWWDVVAGLRHDGGDGPGLTRAAIGVQGLAPYKFEVAATAYLGGPRKAELAVEAEYSVLLSNRLILQPTLEAGIAADDDPRRGAGSGLGHAEAGLRLRYEITRRFAPYVGFVHERRFGRTATLHRDAGEGACDSRWVAGIRFWF